MRSLGDPDVLECRGADAFDGRGFYLLCTHPGFLALFIDAARLLLTESLDRLNAQMLEIVQVTSLKRKSGIGADGGEAHVDAAYVVALVDHPILVGFDQASTDRGPGSRIVEEVLASECNGRLLVDELGKEVEIGKLAPGGFLTLCGAIDGEAIVCCNLVGLGGEHLQGLDVAGLDDCVWLVDFEHGWDYSK